MKFRINLLDESVRPCDRAARESYLRRDERTAARPEDVPAFKGREDWWYGKGLNHRVENGHIVRDMPDEGWFLDADLETLLEHITLYGWSISKDDHRPGQWQLTNYR